ncbi:MAG TPA: tyrosine-type recombinase/integrase, partial [Chitinispirillaceae bacterium]|nr:tyrosine-type recombinase/integrase [Chitinispirillaceae bacterium]
MCPCWTCKRENGLKPRSRSVVIPKMRHQRTCCSIVTPSNRKHRILLMVTCRCGLRLGEIRALHPAYVNIEGQVLWIRKGKGKKDRMVMLDPELIPIMSEWLNDGCGTKYIF